MNMIRPEKHSNWVRLITFTLIMAFLCQNILWAGEKTNEDCLTGQSRLNNIYESWDYIDDTLASGTNFPTRRSGRGEEPSAFSNLGKAENEVLSRVGEIDIRGKKHGPGAVMQRVFERIGKAIPPLNTNVHVFITSRCNFACEQCFFRDRWKQQKISLEAFKKLCDDLRGYETMTILGGEPLLGIKNRDDDIHEMISYASQRFERVRIVTNGLSIYQLPKAEREAFLRGLPENVEILLSEDDDHLEWYKKHTGDRENFYRLREYIADTIGSNRVSIIITQPINEPERRTSGFIQPLFAQGVNAEDLFRKHNASPVSIAKFIFGHSTVDAVNSVSYANLVPFYPNGEKSLYVLPNGDIVDQIEGVGLEAVPEGAKLGNIEEDNIASCLLKATGNQWFNYDRYPEYYYLILSWYASLLGEEEHARLFLDKAWQLHSTDKPLAKIFGKIAKLKIGEIDLQAVNLLAFLVLFNQYSASIDAITEEMFNILETSGKNTVWALDVPVDVMQVFLNKYFDRNEGAFDKFVGDVFGHLEDIGLLLMNWQLVMMPNGEFDFYPHASKERQAQSSTTDLSTNLVGVMVYLSGSRRIEFLEKLVGTIERNNEDGKYDQYLREIEAIELDECDAYRETRHFSERFHISTVLEMRNAVDEVIEILRSGVNEPLADMLRRHLEDVLSDEDYRLVMSSV